VVLVTQPIRRNGLFGRGQRATLVTQVRQADPKDEESAGTAGGVDVAGQRVVQSAGQRGGGAQQLNAVARQGNLDGGDDSVGSAVDDETTALARFPRSR